MVKLRYPDYDNSILNLITSVLKYYNVQTNHSSLKMIDERLEKKYKNVVFMVLDGMGAHVLERIDEDGFFRNKQIGVITSVYPSTTTAALTTYYSGKPPYETGWVAWSQYFKEYGRALDMLSHKESYMREPLKNPNMDVFKDLVNYESIFSQIENASPSVKAYEITPNYADVKSKRSIRANNIDEICENISMLCNNPDEKFIFAYCDNPDGSLHKYGCLSDEVKDIIKDFEIKIEEMCKKLSDDTIVIISADHGHKDIAKAYTLLDYPEIQDCLITPASLESRSVAFWVKEDRKEEFVHLFNKEFSSEFMLLTKQEILDKHLLGYGKKHKKIDDFIGNYLAISISDSIIRLETYLAEGKKVKKSTHCGLTEDEMEVPVIVI